MDATLAGISMQTVALPSEFAAEALLGKRKAQRGEVVTTARSAGTPAPSALAFVVNTLALALFPLIARLLGYEFAIGTSAELMRDARSVLHTVWRLKGVQPAADVAWFSDRYDRAATWIVARHRGRAVGVMALLDMRIASVALDYSRCVAPRDLRLDVTREIGRLAILPGHRGGAQLVMVGLLVRVYQWSSDHGIVSLFSGSTMALYNAYRRFNPTARLVDAPRDPASLADSAKEEYFAPLRAYGGEGVLYTFELAGASPWDVFKRCLTGRLRPSRRA